MARDEKDAATETKQRFAKFAKNEERTLLALGAFVGESPFDSALTRMTLCSSLMRFTDAADVTWVWRCGNKLASRSASTPSKPEKVEILPPTPSPTASTTTSVSLASSMSRSMHLSLLPLCSDSTPAQIMDSLAISSGVSGPPIVS